MKCPERSATNSRERRPEARYAYYRRCQTFRKTGEQCKAPAEKDAHICYAHAQQQAVQERRARERRAVLEAAAREMQRRGRIGFKAADIALDFNAIQVTIAVMAQALIDGRIDSKTAGRLAWELQTASKLLWLLRKAAMRATRSCTKRSTSEVPHEHLFQGLKPEFIEGISGTAKARALIRTGRMKSSYAKYIAGEKAGFHSKSGGSGAVWTLNSSLRDERLPKGPRFASESLDAATASGTVFSNCTTTKAA